METAPYFSSVHDPRVVGRCKHKLSDIRHLEQEKGHGRIDKRSYKILPAEGNLTDAAAKRWPMVKSLIRVEHEVSKPIHSQRTSSSCSRCEAGNVACSPTTSRRSSDFDAEALLLLPTDHYWLLGEGLLLPRPTTSATWGAPLLMQTQSSSATDHLPQEPASPSSYHAGHLNRKCLPLMQWVSAHSPGQPHQKSCT